MHIAAVCCTYLRPKQLGRMIRCFERQNYPHRELVILDDAGQYENACGDRWRLISVSQRFGSLGEKRNAAAALVSAQADALAIWDDDDWYLPWALQASVAALRIAPWSRPSVVLHPAQNGFLRQHRTGGLFHGGWAYRRELFERHGPYAPISYGEDLALATRFLDARVPWVDPIRLGFAPFYVYVWDAGPHLSAMGPDGYQQLGAMRAPKAVPLPADPPDLDLDRPKILPGIHARAF